MSEFLTKEKVKEIVGSAPPELRKDVFNGLVNRGYEIEGFNAKFDFGEAVSNVDNDVAEVATQIWHGVVNADETIKGLSSLGRGALRKLSESVFGEEITQAMSDLQKSMPGGIQTIGDKYDKGIYNAVVDMFYNKYGSKDKFLNTIEKEPIQFLGDLSILLNPASGALKTALAGTRFSKVANVTNRLVRALEPTTALRETAGGVIGIFKSPLKHSFTRMMGVSTAQLKDLAKSTRTFPGDPTDWLIKHGISPTNGLNKMSQRLDEISVLTRQKLDDVLSVVPNKFKHTDTKSLLGELKKFYSKEKVDIVEGVDITKETKTILNQQGFPFKVSKEKGIPYRQKEPVFVPKENLSEVTLGKIERIKELSENVKSGLTLSEMNEVKRLSDEVFNIYNKAGEAKGIGAAKELGKLRKSTRKFIEDTADDMANQYGKNLKEVAALNQQSQYARGWKDIADETRLIGAKQHGIAESILGVGALTSFLYGQPAQTGAFLGAIGVMEFSRLPRVKSFILTKLGTMGTGDFKKLLGEFNQFSKTQKIGIEMRKMRREFMRYARYAGIIQEKQQKLIPIKQQQQIPLQTTKQDEVRIQ